MMCTSVWMMHDSRSFSTFLRSAQVRGAGGSAGRAHVSLHARCRDSVECALLHNCSVRCFTLFCLLLASTVVPDRK